jgi:AcrR family transcriptional regulator
MAKGFAAASLDELAAASGLNRPSLYAAFGDKEQLYIATLRFYGARNVEGLEAILAGPARSSSASARSTRPRSISTPRRRTGRAA